MQYTIVGLSLLCPCITFGANAEMMGEDWMLYCLFCVLPGATCYFGPYIRSKIRKSFGIEVMIRWQVYEQRMTTNNHVLYVFI